MKRELIIGMCLLGLAFFTACSKEDEDLTPSFADQEWYKLEDSDDAVDHAFFELFQTYGIPVYYNDTIGWEDRGLSREGEKMIHYEVMDIAYWITSRTSNPALYSLNKKYLENGDKSQLLNAAEFLGEYVFPYLKKSRYPMSFLLVDSIVNNHSDVRARHVFNSYHAMTTTLIGGVDRIGEMSEREKRLLAGYVMAELYVYDIKNNEAYMNLFTEFFDSSVGATGQSLYGLDRGTTSTSIFSSSYLLTAKEWLKYGFLRYNPTKAIGLLSERVGNKVETNNDLSTMDTKLIGYSFPLRDQDLYEYVARVLAGDDEAFESEYADYPKILEKYNLMKTLLPLYLEQID